MDPPLAVHSTSKISSQKITEHLTTPILRQIMESVKYHGNVRSFIQQNFEMFDSFLLCEVQPEFLLELFVHIAMFDVWDICVHHEGDQVEDKVGAFPEDTVCSETEILEACVMRRLCATHAVDHFFAYLDLRGKGLWVSPKDISEVN